MAAILNSAILDSPILHKTLTQTISIWLKLIHFHLTWWWQPSWILPSWILPCLNQPFCTKLWLKLIQFDSNSFILIQLDDGSHLEFCHLEIWLLDSAILHKTLTQTNSILTQTQNSDSFNHSNYLFLMMAAILNSMPSWIQPFGFTQKLWLWN